MLVCPLCRIALGPSDSVCPRDGHAPRSVVPYAVPETLLKRFQILEPFAHGDAGTLYLADEPETGRRGLLKMLAPVPKTQLAERQRLRRELVKQATLESAHVGTPLATGESEGVTWLFREWLDGVSLRVRISRGGALVQAEALAIAAQLASALDDLHRAGLLHRDLKPGHVFLQPTTQGLPRVVLIDAGLSTPIEVEGRAPVLGVPGYVAPEQLLGKLVSFRSDLYALGCVMYEMLTGQPAYTGETVEATLEAQLSGEIPGIPADLPNGVGTLLKSLLAKDPQERPFSAQKLRRTLDPYLPDGAPVTRQPTATFATLPEQRKSMAPSPTGTLRPPPPPSSAQGSRLPPAPQAGAPRPPTRSSLPPPPPPSAKKSADTTQQIDLEQIMDMAPAVARSSTVPPPPAPSKKDATQALDLDQVLEIVSDAPAAPAAAPAAPPPRPSADHTQPIRLDQILAVAETRKKELAVPPPMERASAAPATPSERTEAPAESAHAEPSTSSSESAPQVEALELPIDVEHEPVTATAEAAPSVAAEASVQPESASTATHDDRTIADVAPSDSDDDGDHDDAATVVAARPDEHAPIAVSPAHKSTLLGMPPLTTEAAQAITSGPVASAPMDTPAAVRLSGSMGPDSGQLTVPRDAAAAIAEARRMDAEASGPVTLPGFSSRKLAYYAAAAAVVLGLGIGASAMLGGDEGEVSADKAKVAAVTAEPKAASVAASPEATPSVQPMAETPKTNEPAPTVTAIVPAEPVVATPEPAASNTPAPSSESDREARAESSHRSSRASDREERRERRERAKSDSKLSDAEKSKRWAEARDAARAHYAAKRYRQAAEAYEQAAKYNPTHAGTFAGLGAARLQVGDAKGAVQAYQKAIQLSPSTSGFHAALGRAYMLAGDKGRARSAYKKALALDANNTAAKQALAELGG